MRKSYDYDNQNIAVLMCDRYSVTVHQVRVNDYDNQNIAVLMCDRYSVTVNQVRVNASIAQMYFCLLITLFIFYSFLIQY